MGHGQRRAIVFEQHQGAAGAPLAPKYRPRKPEQTVLHRMVLEHLQTMLAQARQRTEHGFGYPRFVEREFRRYLECGQLPHGFVRLKCKTCGYERLLAFSCKGRLCPSCHARRMHDTAIHLVDHVLPRVPYRQWVFTLPRPIRFLMARDAKVLSGVLNIFVRTVFAWQRRAAKRDGFAAVLPGAVSFVQFFGGALNLNPHFHSLLLDGVFVEMGPEHKLVFLELMGPTQLEVEALTLKLAHRVTRFIGTYEEQHGLDLEDRALDDLDDARARALQPVLPAPQPDGCAEERSEREPYRCAFALGFSLHANVALAADDREALLRLVRYGARQAFSQQQLAELPDGRLRYTLKRPFGPGGARQLILEPTELLHRLAALCPRPYLNLTRFHGVFAPNANRRNEVCPQTSSRRPAHRHPPPRQDKPPDTPLLRLPPGPPPRSRVPWAELLRRTYAVDVLKCPSCLTGTLAVLAFITDPSVVLRILSHLRLPTEVPATRPARLEPQLELDWELADGDQPSCDLVGAEPRAPPA